MCCSRQILKFEICVHGNFVHTLTVVNIYGQYCPNGAGLSEVQAELVIEAAE